MNKKIIYSVAGVICAVSIVFMIFALSSKPRTEVIFNKPAFDDTAIEGKPSSPPESYSSMSVSGYTVILCGEPVIDGDVMQLYLTNPDSNAIYLKARIMNADGDCVGESGLLKPGEYVSSIEIDSSNNATEKKYTVKIMAYEEDTYKSAGAVNLNVTAAES